MVISAATELLELELLTLLELLLVPELELLELTLLLEPDETELEELEIELEELATTGALLPLPPPQASRETHINASRLNFSMVFMLILD